MLRLSNSLLSLKPRPGSEYTAQSRTVLATDESGFIVPESKHGLWVYLTRMISRYRWLINGTPPELSAGSNIEEHSWLAYYVIAPPNCRETQTADCNPLQQTLELRLTRFVGEGMHEDLDITNHTQIATEFRLELEIDADFAAPEEAGGERRQFGELTRCWRQMQQGCWQLAFDYRAQHRWSHQGDEGVASLHRGLMVSVEHTGSEPDFHDGKIGFSVKLAPHGCWHVCLLYRAQVEDHLLPLQYGCYGAPRSSQEGPSWDRQTQNFLASSTQFHCPDEETLSVPVVEVLRRSKKDLAALRLHDQDQDLGWVPAAGFPTYVGLFDRDSLAAGWETLTLSPELTIGALSALPHYQGKRIDNWRDEQPGRFAHELHTDPVSVLNYDPHGRYYGSVTGSIYYPTVVAGLWHWTGDQELVRPFVEPALRGLRWADQYGDIDGDGFYEYKTLSEQGEHNQGWKDSDDALVHEDGSQAAKPLGTCEMQAFAYSSKLHFSELLWWLGETDLARKLYHEAAELKARFNERFWVDDLQYIAMGLDREKRQIRSIASDPGHCLASGIVEGRHARPVAERLMAEDMFSGWGIRTLSALHPAFNPFAYHRGTVWPVENAVFVLAFARYGLHNHMHRLAQAFFESACLFQQFRLPELLAGHERSQRQPFPGMYTRANWPQAWSASAPFTVLQALLGIYPYAPLDVLFLDPVLPPWLPEITLEHMRVGKARVTIRFYREPSGRSHFEVLDLQGPLHVIRQPSPWSLTAGFGEKVKDTILSLLPGRAA